MVTTAAPDQPDWVGNQSPVTVPTLVQALNVPSGTSSAWIDVSAFEAITVNGLAGIVGPLRIAFGVNVGGGIIRQIGQQTPIGNRGLAVPVQGQYVQFTQDGALPYVGALYGLPRNGQLVSGIVNGWQASDYHGAVASQAWVNGTGITAALQGDVQIPQGPVSVVAKFSLTTFSGEVFCDTVSGNAFPLIDSTNCAVNSGGVLAGQRMTAIPADGTGIRIQPHANQTSSADVFICPAY